MARLVTALLALETKKRRTLAAVLMALIAVAGYFLAIAPANERHTAAVEEQNNVKEELLKKRTLAGKLSKARQDYAITQLQLQEAIKALPEESEIPDLLTAITRAGRNQGLDFELFRPKKEVPTGIYATLPIDIAVSGSYRQVVAFMDEVARLTRIVDLSNISVTAVQNKDQSRIKLTCTATTYRYLKQEAKNDQKKK